MGKALATAILGVALLLSSAAPSAAIINGTEGVSGENSSLVSVHYSAVLNDPPPALADYDPMVASYFCAGTLVAPTKVVTAAHCLFLPPKLGGDLLPADQFTVGWGDVLDGTHQVRRVVSAVPHPDFNPRTPDKNDIAVLTIDAPFPNAQYSRVALPWLHPATPAGTPVRAAGWGVTRNGGSIESVPSTVRVADMVVAPRRVCGQFTSRPFAVAGVDFYGLAIRKSSRPFIICAIGVSTTNPGAVVDTCSGDSGGPLIDRTNGRLVGVVSWGRGCAGTRPAAYTNVVKHFDFLVSEDAVLPEATQP